MMAGVRSDEALRRLLGGVAARSKQKAPPEALVCAEDAIFESKFLLHVEAANDASRMVRSLFYFHLTAMLVVGLVVGSTTDLDLLLNEGVKLPFYDAGINLTLFFVTAPVLVLCIHLNLLLKLDVLRRKIYDLEQQATCAGDEQSSKTLREAFRLVLFPFDFTQIVARQKRTIISTVLIALVFAATVYVAPLLILLGVQLRFLAFQSEGATWLQQAVVFIDAVTLFLFAFGFRGVTRKAIAAAFSGVLAGSAIATSLFWFSHPPATFAISRPMFGYCTEEFLKEPQAQDVRYPETIEGNDQFKLDHRNWQFAKRDCKAIAYRRPGEGAAGNAAEDSQGAATPTAGPLEGIRHALWDVKAFVDDRRLISVAYAKLWTSSGVDREILESVFPEDNNNSRTADQAQDEDKSERDASFEIVMDDAPSVETRRRFVQPVKLARRHLDIAYFAKAEMPDADLREIDAWDATFVGAQLPRANFSCVGAVQLDSQSDLSDLARTDRRTKRRGYCSDLRDADFDFARLDDAQMSYARAKDSTFHYAVLQGADLYQSDFGGADFSYARLDGADVSNARLDGADFSNARLDGADVSNARLDGADFSYARLDGADFGSATLDGSYLWQTNFALASLSGASFGGVESRGAIFVGADLASAKTFGAFFRCTTFSGARIDFSDEGGVVFDNVDFSALERGRPKPKCSAFEVDVDAVFATIDAAAADCDEGLLERGLIEKVGATCQAKSKIATDPAVIESLLSPGARVCQEFGDVITDQGLIELADCDDRDVVVAWYGHWRREAKAKRSDSLNYIHDIDSSDQELEELCPLDPDKALPEGLNKWPCDDAVKVADAEARLAGNPAKLLSLDTEAPALSGKSPAATEPRPFVERAR